jgi:hypothetical protein
MVAVAITVPSYTPVLLATEMSRVAARRVVSSGAQHRVALEALTRFFLASAKLRLVSLQHLS